MPLLTDSRQALDRRDDFPPQAAAQPTGPLQRMPRRAAPSVAELSARLFAAYSVEGGAVRLAGCTLEPQAIVHAVGRCITSAGSVANVESQATSTAAATALEQPIELFISTSGELLDQTAIADLGLKELIAADKPPRLSHEEIERQMTLGRTALDDRCRQLGGTLSALEAPAGAVRIEIVWCRWAAGKLRFTIGEKFVELPFADWAVRLQPPPFVCSHTGKATFKLATTDDYRIAAAEEIAACQQSGRRMLQTELVTCSITGKQIARDLAETCPVTGQPVLREQLTQCPVCWMQVSPQAIAGTQCMACAKSAAVTKADPRMCLILGEHPGLDRWHRFRIAETLQSYVVEARGLLRRLLVVVDKRTLEAVRVAGRNRFLTTWTDIPSDGWREWLQ